MAESSRGRCITLRVQGKGVRAIARELGLSHSTVVEHLAHPEARKVLDAVGRRAVQMARDELEASVPEVARKARRVAMGLEKAKPDQVQAMKLVMMLAGMEPAKRVELSGGLDIRGATDDALRARLEALRGAQADDDGTSDPG